MKKFEKKYFCTNCRQQVAALNELYFIEEDSQRGFCGEMCIEKYYLPVVEQLEKIDSQLKTLDNLHSGDFDHLNNDNEIVERVFSEPDEVYFQKNEVGETIYFFHKKFPEGHTGISICHMYNQEPSFIYLCSVTDSASVIEYYKAGDKAKINKNPPVPELKKEEAEYIEQKKSLYLAAILENRADKDISFEDFPFYQNYLPKTMNDPDEIYELMDSEGDKFYSYIKTFEKNGESFYYITLCIKGPFNQKESNEVYPVIAVPSTCANFYKSFKSESVISSSIKN
jgi:hypothetical protein